MDSILNNVFRLLPLADSDVLRRVLDAVPHPIFVKDDQHRFVVLNHSMCEFMGRPYEELVGRTDHDFVPKEHADVFQQTDTFVLESGQINENEELFTDVRGVVRTLITRKKRASLANGASFVVGCISDITELKQREERIAYLANHDAVTGLPNRLAFAERLTFMLERAQASNETFAVLCLDLDRFKDVNDIFGHSTGDALLREMAERLGAACLGSFLARVGGDEFTLIVVDGPRPAGAVAMADRLLATVAEEFEIEGHRVQVGLSVGIAFFPTDGSNARTLLGNADAALYRAKADGRGVIRLFEAEMDQRLREQRAIQQDLRSAVARGELTLHYQPQARISGGIIGFEALVRWRHPDRGLMSPATFIPAAEESGLIIPIGEWILREACREAASWPQPLQIAINLSPIQFRQGDLPSLVHAILMETGLAPGRLELEITEGVLIDDFSRAVSTLRRLKLIGVQIAMDDFGTGYSSLSYLQSFPFDKIKIDRAFIGKLESNPQSAAIVRAVVGLGRGLAMGTVAEGVETQEQLTFLRDVGCEEVQGYFIGRPGPISDYLELVGREGTLVKPRALTVASAG